MTQPLSDMRDQFKTELAAQNTIESIENLRIGYFGKKGKITGLMRGMAALSIEEKKTYGAALNALKAELFSELESKKQKIEKAELDAKLASETIDMTLPPRPEQKGSIHPISQTIAEFIEIFGNLGFSVAEGPDIETDFNNFGALNFPDDHPARLEHDTFYMQAKDGEERKVLRTHTSPVQIRTMLKQEPPFRIIAPGRTYRCDDDATHSPNFHQIEGLAIDTNINMAHLKWTLQEFCKTYFEVDHVKMRFRPSYFPFVEPGAEVDIGCHKKNGVLHIGEGDDWMEILGCGMVHPNVLESCGIDPEKYQGFAFGMGIERAAMLKHGISDLRRFYESDVRWLQHYGFDGTQIPTLTGGLSA